MARRRTRVLVLTPDFRPARGGIQLLVQRLVSNWLELQTLVVTRHRPRHGGPSNGIAALNIRALVEASRFRPDVVLSAHIAVSPAARILHRLARVPYVQYVYGMEVCDRPQWARFAVRRAAAVIAISQYSASLVASYLDRCPLHRIPPGVDSSVAVRGERWEKPLVVTVSRLAERYKGHDVMLRALPLVLARVPDVTWVVIGDGPLRPAYEGMAWALGLSDHVRFLGAIEDDERDQWLDRAHVFAMPSRLSATGGGEGFGISYLEAGVHRLPAVAGNVAGAVDAVVDGVTGLLLDPTDHVAVADAIADLLSDRPRAEALGRAGEIRAREFAWPMAAYRVQCLLEQIASSRAA